MTELPLTLVPFIDGKEQMPEHRQMIWLQLDESYICTARYLDKQYDDDSFLGFSLMVGADITTEDILWHVGEYGFRWLPIEQVPYIEYKCGAR